MDHMIEIGWRLSGVIVIVTFLIVAAIYEKRSGE